jgi:hypothetical protein
MKNKVWNIGLGIALATVGIGCMSKSGEISRRMEFETKRHSLESSLERLNPQSDTVKWNAFLECSKNEGDWGCDSCFHKIYGYRADDPGYLKYGVQDTTAWVDDVRNPDNHEFVVEVSFNNGDIPLNEVTQEMFNARYLSRNK